ncbi:ABC transporter permease subunit [Gracilibacillus kekensis]|uniref:ABC-2 type transport system permease protein n=1 Tax=Gracilibacillus kekensis TaxID=1027249 RepID=A0A1M7LHV1_9BACI|nr:ABC transporter permease subunit [Gracilibacillus kekensis]SHM77201.1 ABC-2 type transport system permease protein [Gracilibacillus kekensis]
MLAICKREFIQSFKGIKSIIVIAIFLITAYYSADFSNLFLSLSNDFTSEEKEVIHTIGISILSMFFGMLFVMGLSHDTVNREIHERTIRFLVTRTSRASIIFGKFLGIALFWFVCLLTSFVIISIFVRDFDFIIFFQSTSLAVYYSAFTVLMSVLLPKPSLTMFLSIVIGLAFPIFNGWVTLTSNGWVSWLKYVLPFYYTEDQNFEFLVILLLAGVMIYIALLVFRRREC